MQFIARGKYPSVPEEIAVEGFERFGLKPERNYKVDFFEIDFAFPERKVGIEIQSWEYHKDRDRDIRRWRYLESKGWKMYFFMAKIVMQDRFLPAAYVYTKEFAEDKELTKSAQFHIYKYFRQDITDEERQLFKMNYE